MLTEVMEHFGLARDLLGAGYYETEHHRQLAKDVRAAILAGRLVAVAGIVGSGKTVMLRRLQEDLGREGKVTVAKSLSVDKDRTTIPTLFHDLSPDKDPKIPSQGEKWERELQQLVRRGRKPVALLVDEAHDLHAKTLIGLKRLMEVVADSGGMLSVVLVGHPKLRNDLRRPTLEEIGYRCHLRVRWHDQPPDPLNPLAARHLRGRGRCSRQQGRGRCHRPAGEPAEDAAADRAAPDARLRGGVPWRRTAGHAPSGGGRPVASG
jgi:type II secretory pathway predicted ATPase ExeA